MDRKRVIILGLYMVAFIVLATSLTFVFIEPEVENDTDTNILDYKDELDVNERTRQNDPSISFVEPSAGYKGSTHEIMGSFLNDTGGRVGLEPIAGDDIIWLPASAIVNWGNESVNITIPSNITEGEYYVIIERNDGVSGSWWNIFNVVLEPKITSVTDKDAIYRESDITINGENFGTDYNFNNVRFIKVIEGQETVFNGMIAEWNESYIIVMVPFNSELKGKCDLVVVGNEAVSKKYSITIKEATVKIISPGKDEKVHGTVEIKIEFPKGTNSINVSIYKKEDSQSESGYTEPPEPVFEKEYKVSEKSSSKTIQWDSTEVDNEAEYYIYVDTYGVYGKAYTSVYFKVKQIVANVVAVAAVIVGSAAVAFGAGAAMASGGGAAGAAGAAAPGAGVGTGGGENWLIKLLNKLRKLFGDVIEEKAEDLIEKGSEKIDEKIGDSSELMESIKGGVPLKAFIISLGIATVAFSIFINGGVLGWKGWIDLIIAIPCALLVVVLLMGVKNIFGFWLGNRINVKIKWRMGIIGLFVLVVSSLFSAPMGEIGEQENSKWKYASRSRKHLKALSVMSSSFVMLSMLVVFGALAFIDNGFVLFWIAYPGIFACLVLALFPLFPFKSSPGNLIWKWSKVVNLSMLVGIMGVLVPFSQLWIPGWTLIFVGVFAFVVLVLFLFMFGVLGGLASSKEIKARRYTNLLSNPDPEKREKARKKMIGMMVMHPDALRKCIPDLLAAEPGDSESRKAHLDLISHGSEMTPWLFIPYREDLLRHKERSQDPDIERWKEITAGLEEKEKIMTGISHEELKGSLVDLLKPRKLKKDKRSAKKEKAVEGKGESETERPREEDVEKEVPIPPDEMPPAPEEGSEMIPDETDTKEEEIPSENEKGEKTVERKCPGCGGELASPYKFCTGCGMKMDEEPAGEALEEMELIGDGEIEQEENLDRAAPDEIDTPALPAAPHANEGTVDIDMEEWNMQPDDGEEPKEGGAGLPGVPDDLFSMPGKGDDAFTPSFDPAPSLGEPQPEEGPLPKKDTGDSGEGTPPWLSGG